ncbi:AAA family ATPase [Leptolyngbya sp. 'hensonii']|uniref:AAA family ATPase n=1 Tax=Leptolyngbya sp. 'hensonii' TaxID=1922337 RepID=UPI0015C52518|nr:AAA family ATPase [Leptolyngbya sp. 'hensonii']
MFDLQELTNRLKSGYGSVAIDCPIGSQNKLELLLVRMAIDGGQTARTRRQPVTWDVADGIQSYPSPGQMMAWEPQCWVKTAVQVPAQVARAGEPAPCSLLRYLIHQASNAQGEACLYILYDLPRFLLPHPQFEVVNRLLKRACTVLNYSNSRMILVHHGHQFGEEFQDLISEMEYPLPDEPETRALVQQQLQELQASAQGQGQQIPDELTPQDLTRTVRALLGLTEEGQINLLQYAVRKLRAIDHHLPGAINQMKQRQLIRLGIEYAPAPDVPAQGLTTMDEWVQMTSAALDPRAREFNLPNPRSLLLIGPPGTGKSLICKELSSRLGLACIILDFGNLMTKELGGSEQKLRDILKAASTVSPCLLMVDEMDKAIGQSAQEGDGGTSQRLIATFLRWLNDHEEPVIVIATANRPTFSPELLRRFTRVFVDLPTLRARKQIFQVHLQLRHLLPDPLPTSGRLARQYNTWLDTLAGLTEDYTGDEISQIVIKVAYNAFIKVRDGAAATVEDLLPVTLEELEAVTRSSPPQHRGQYREREMLLEWVKNGMAIHANPPEPVAAGARISRRSVSFED